MHKEEIIEHKSEMLLRQGSVASDTYIYIRGLTTAERLNVLLFFKQCNGL